MGTCMSSLPHRQLRNSCALAPWVTWHGPGVRLSRTPRGCARWSFGSVGDVAIFAPMFIAACAYWLCACAQFVCEFSGRSLATCPAPAPCGGCLLPIPAPARGARPWRTEFSCQEPFDGHGQRIYLVHLLDGPHAALPMQPHQCTLVA